MPKIKNNNKTKHNHDQCQQTLDERYISNKLNYELKLRKDQRSEFNI